MNESKLKSVWVALIVIAIIAVFGLLLPRIQVQESGNFGSSGSRFPNGLAAGVDANVGLAGETVVSEFTQGGGILAVTDANGGVVTLTEANLLSANVLSMTASGAGQEVIALTLPATSTMTTLIPKAGDFREWIIDASALAAATTTTVTLGTGIDLIAVTTADDVIDGAEWARLSCWRQADTDVTCITSELLNAD